MTKTILLGIVLAAIVWVFAIPAPAYACGGCMTDPWMFNEKTYEQRMHLYEHCEPPPAPEGYSWNMDDLTLVADY
jgi:hypothetical protein